MWEKRGLVYAPSGELWWARKYAAFPTAEIGPGVVRVYFTALDDHNFGRVGFVELDATDPGRILYETKEPVLDIGELGTFEDSGVSAFSIVSWGGNKYMFYQGWQRSVRTPYVIMTGAAIATGPSAFRKTAKVPILDRTNRDSLMRAAPCVVRAGDLLKMWYVSCLDWVRREGSMHYRIVIRYAQSSNGVIWEMHDDICLQPNFDDEYAVGRPWVIYEEGLYKMWYSIRSFSELYVIGYAESDDGIHWQRKDDMAKIAKSPAGWDSEMICYPCVVDVNGVRYLFYNGNGHGSTGFGYAVLRA